MRQKSHLLVVYCVAMKSSSIPIPQAIYWGGLYLWAVTASVQGSHFYRYHKQARERSGRTVYCSPCGSYHISCCSKLRKKKKRKKNLISVAHGLRMFLVESVVISSSSSYTLLQVILPNDVLSSRKGHRHPAVNTLCPWDSKPPVESFQH